MNQSHILKIAGEMAIAEKRVHAVSELLEQGATVPFIARYRKEATDSLDEVAIAAIRDRLTQLFELEKRREAILHSLSERNLLTEELKNQILAAETLSALEDIYLPYRPKRRTRATAAREKGLEPLAKLIFAQEEFDVISEAAAYISPEKGVQSADDALSGARDIIAEWISEDSESRAQMRMLFESEGILKSKAISGKESAAGKYRDYFDWSEPISKSPSHRLLAMMRAEKEGLLSLHVAPPEDCALEILDGLFVLGSNSSSEQVRLAAKDGYKRLLAPSMETEMLSLAKMSADERAIGVFAENLRQLLLEAPMGQKNVLAVDPGFRTGCKLAVLDSTGRLMHSDTIYPHEPHNRSNEAAEKVIEICKRFCIDVIAVGNGTAGRETELFLRKVKFSWAIPVLMVSEAGASVYSVSEVARQEFPDQDATVRGAVSIGRRLMDPLSELVKIEPMAMGVGQYQHDVDQSALKRKLDDVVESCVNLVGVDVNTASKEILAYVSGLGPKLALAIVKYRNEHGPFRSRRDLRNVPRLGEKVFEQAAGFLRIRGGDNPLDGSAVHPESYEIISAMAKDLGVSVQELVQNKELQKKIDLKKYVTDKIGMPTLEDILSELAVPGRDPREKFEAFSFQEGVEKLEDLKVGMKLPGIVTNITAFGAFVDIGVHQDGLIHISQMSNKFIRNPSDVVKVHQKVTVKVLDVDSDRKRIALSMKEE
ncbi:MAG: Tex family protein [Methanotrichaceae archaeon]